VPATELTPAGTGNVCSLPVEENVHITVEPDCEQFDGNAAAAEPAGATAHNPNDPASTTNNPTARVRAPANQPTGARTNANIPNTPTHLATTASKRFLIGIRLPS
jgi:hypothetical protein